MKLKNNFITKTSHQRLLNIDRPIIAITGSIATGKSTVSAMLQKKQIEVVCADSIIKQIYNSSRTIEFISSLSSNFVTQEHQIDFALLRKKFFQDSTLKQTIEEFLFAQYPKYLQEAFGRIPHDFIIYDIPLLFEKGLARQVDQSVCVYSSPQKQLQRILKRDKCDAYTAQQIIDSQMSIDDKKNLANYVITNNSSLQQLEAEVNQFITYFFTDL